MKELTKQSRELILMKTAELWAEKGTCSRAQVGAVFAREGRILVQGYNGAPAGLPHCDHSCDCARPPAWDLPGFEHMASCNSLKPCDRAVHAEQNGIAWAAREGVGLKGADLYSTHEPCINCARSIINAGIGEVYFRYPYRLHDGLYLLEEAGIMVRQFVGQETQYVIELGQ